MKDLVRCPGSVFVILESSLFGGLHQTGVPVILGSYIPLYQYLYHIRVFVISGSPLYWGLRYNGVFVVSGFPFLSGCLL